MPEEKLTVQIKQREKPNFGFSLFIMIISS